MTNAGPHSIWRKASRNRNTHVLGASLLSPEADSGGSSEKGATLGLIVDKRLHRKVGYEFIVRTGSTADAVLNAAREFESDYL
jgi:hypothetical protein